MSDYLGLAKKVVKEASSEVSKTVLAERRDSRLEEAGRRGFIARQSREPGWISMHDPTTGEWHDFPATDCFPSIVEEANKKRRTGRAS